MKYESNKNIFVYIVLIIVILGVVYTACKDIMPHQERIENEVELKLSK